MRDKKDLCRIAALLILALPAGAANYTWDGGGTDSNWGTANNWNANGVPVNGDTLTWNGSGGSNTKFGGTNNLAVDTDIAGLSFINAIGGHTLGGNRIELTGNISNTTSNGTGVQVLNFDILLSGATRTFTASPTVALTAGNTHALTFNGVISGDQDLTLTGNANGKIMLAGANTYTGSTSIGGGTVTLSGGNNRLPTTTSLGFTGTSTLNIGATSQELDNLSVGNGVTATISGSGGTLTLGANNLAIGGTAAGQAQTLNMSGLSNFVFDGASRTISIGPQINVTGNERGYLTLANDNTITALSLNVGGVAQSPWSADASNEDAQLFLGQTNVINASTINVGVEGGPRGLVQFRSGLTANPTLTIRGTSGGSSRADITVGRVGDVYTVPFTKMDLTAGVSGTSVLDAMVGSLAIASMVQNACAAEFIMGGGTLDAQTIKVSHLLSGSSYGNNFTGRFRLNGGTVITQTLQMSQDDGTGQSYGELYLNSGTIKVQNLTAGNGSGKTINWNDGTIRNYDASTNLSIASGITINLLTAGTHTFTADAARTITVASGLAGVGALTKSGAGTLALTAANSYSGATGVNAGTLSLTGSLTGGTAITVNNDAVFTQSAAGVISGAASFTHNSSATSFLSGANPYTGVTTVNGGVVIATSASSAGTNSGLTLNGGAFEYRPAVAGALARGSGVLNFSGGSRIGTLLAGTVSQSAITSSAAAVASGNITVDVRGLPVATSTGTHNLITAASGLTAGGATYTLGNLYDVTHFTVNPGGFSYSDTAVSLAVTAATPLSDAYWKGGYTGSANVWSVSNGLTASNWATDVSGTDTPLTPGSAATLRFSATGATNQGAMVLGANMSVGGIVVDSSSAVTLNADGYSLSLGTGGITLNSGAGATTLASPVVLSGNQTWANNASNTLTASGGLSVSGTLAKTGSGALVLSGTSTNTGAMAVNGGTLTVSGGNAIGDTVAVTLANTGGVALQLNSSETVGSLAGGGASGGNVLLGSNTLTTGDASTTTFSGIISGDGGSLVKSGAGTFTLSGASANTYTGVTMFGSGGAAGVLKLQKTSGVNAIGGNLANNGGGQVEWGASEQIPDTSTVDYGNNGHMHLTLLGNTETVAGITATAGLGVIQNRQSQTSINSSGTFIVNGGGTSTFNGYIRNSSGGSGTGVLNLVKSGSGTLTVSGANITYTGATTVTGGVLKLENTTAWNSNISNSATVELYSSGNWALGAGETLSGNGTYLKTGSGLVRFSNHVIQATGTIQIQGGTLQNDSNSMNWTAATADLDISAGAIMDLYADAVYVDVLTGAGFVQNNYGNATAQSGSAAYFEKLVVGTNNGNGSFAGTIRNNSTGNAPGSGTNGGGVDFEKVGTGTQTLSGNNTYTGLTTVTAGVLAAQGGSALPDASRIVMANTAGAQLQVQTSEWVGLLTGGGAAGGDVALSPGVTLTTGVNNGTGSHAGVISGSNASLVKRGTGTQTLTGANTFSGGVTILQGTLAVPTLTGTGNAQPLGMGTSPILFADNGATLSVTGTGVFDTNRGLQLSDGANTLSVAGTLNHTGEISGGGPSNILTKSGAGTFNFAGAGNWNGNLEVAQGTFAVTGGGAIGGIGFASAAAGTTLEVNTTGAVQASRLDIAPGGTVRLEAGTLRLAGGSLNGGATQYSINQGGVFNWTGGTLAVYAQSGLNLKGTTDRSDPTTTPEAKEGSYLSVSGNLTVPAGASVDLGASFQNANEFRYNQFYVTGTLSLSNSDDTLNISINPYFLRPFGYAEEFGTLVLAYANVINGQFDSITGIVSDEIGWAGQGTFTDSNTDASLLPANTYLIEYRTGFGAHTQAGGDVLLLHYKITGVVPEPASAGLFIGGVLLLRALRRRK